MRTDINKKSTQISNLHELDNQLIKNKAEFEAVLPKNCTVDRFIRVVKTAVIQNNGLLEADRVSLLSSCIKCASDGLLPDGREAALVNYNNKQKDGSYKKVVQYMPMTAGILKKIRNSGELASISAHVVYDKDEFDYCLGDDEHISHKPAMNNRGKPICVYTIVKTKDNAIYREVMSYDEIEKIRKSSRNEDSIPWTQHWSEMAKKTVIRRLAKRLPMNSDVDQVIQRDDEYSSVNYSVQQNNQALNQLDYPQNNTIEYLNQLNDESSELEVEQKAISENNN